jgi:hypothetical protein
MDCFLVFFFSDWNVLLYLWSHVPYRYWNNLSIHTVRTAGKSHSHILTHGKNYAYIKSTLWNFWIWDSLICLSAWCSNSRRANIFFCIHYPLGRPVQGQIFFFFALNWVFKLDHFCSNWITFRNGVWVRAEECARMNTNGPILWRIVCRGCGWSFFKF